MSKPTHTNELNGCGCCEPGLVESAHHNPPGQPQLSYRLGSHATFFRRMITHLPRWQVPDGPNKGRQSLAALSARRGDDPAIALLDAWAVISDVLTFYQERIANEGYLRTATERRSVLELARAIGYELSPGVAAETYLAFTVDDTADAPQTVTIPMGTQVQSIPKTQGELPQTFEVAEEFIGRPEWNELRPQLTKPQDTPILITGPKASLKTLYLEGRDTDLQPGDKILIVIQGDNGMGTISKVEPVGNNTLVYYELYPQPGSVSPGGGGAIGDSSLNAPASGAAPGSGGGDSAQPSSGSSSFSFANINFFLTAHTFTESELQSELKEKNLNQKDFQDTANITIGGGNFEVYAFREKVGIFGHNAPRHETLSQEMKTVYKNPWDEPPLDIWKDSLKDPLFDTNYDHADMYLERAVNGVVKNSWVILEKPEGLPLAFKIIDVIERSMTGFALTARATGLDLELGDEDKSQEPLSDFTVRETTAYVKSERLRLAEKPVAGSISSGDTELKLDGLVLGLQVGQAVAVSGEQEDAPGVERREVLHLRQVLHDKGFTTLRFRSGLRYSYKREMMMINANVMRATHGETTAAEILGSGDAAQAHQRFLLRKPPLTYVSAPTANGVASTLSVRVNGLSWQEAPSLYDLDGDSQRYIVRLNNEGETLLLFGDGRKGARLPTGQENVVAAYRSGIGVAGEVGVDSLALLKTRPFGVRSVTNPVAASGSADPETPDKARDNAPLTVLTLDRIVSLQDYEDFSRAFAGIDKAQAVVMWDGEKQVVHITIAGTGGQTISPNSTLYRSLRQAIDAARDPLQEVRLGSYQPLFFNIKAKLLIDPAYLFADVQAQVESALLDAFSFDQRAFGQSVTAAEIVRIMHGVPGVSAVDLDGLAFSSAPDDTISITLDAVLPAKTARPKPGGTGILTAQLLLANDAGLTLTEMTS